MKLDRPQYMVPVDLSKLKIGDQIAYIPPHVQEMYRDENGVTIAAARDKDTEFGFVFDIQYGNVYCRYWRSAKSPELRTKANSELTPVGCLFGSYSHYDSQVRDAILAIKEGTLK